MRKTLEVLWAVAAESDLLEIAEFIAEDDPAAAREVLGRIHKGTTRPGRSPRSGRVVPELMRQGVSRYREIVVKPWRVVYRVGEDRVFVVAVIDGRRSVEDLLLARLLRGE